MVSGKKSSKAYIVVVDLNSSDSMKKAFNLVRVLGTMEQRREDRTETPLVLFGNKEDLVGKITSSARKELISSLILLLKEIEKRDKFGVFFHGSLKHNYVTRIEFGGKKLRTFVNELYSKGYIESGLNRSKSRSQVNEIVHFLIECGLVDWEQVKHLELALNDDDGAADEKKQGNLQAYNAKTNSNRDDTNISGGDVTSKRSGFCGGDCVLM